MDINEEIRFRVVDEVFTDLSPAGPEMSGEKQSADETENKRSPYVITVSHFALQKFSLCMGKKPLKILKILIQWQPCWAGQTVTSNRQTKPLASVNIYMLLSLFFRLL